MTFAEQPITDFIDDVAAGNATPGGGSVAAIAGAAGAALEEMVCNLTIGREEFAEVEADLSEAHEELTAHRVRLLELADEDSAAFEAVMDAYQTPEDEGRAQAIQDASKLATEVPLETAEECLAVLERAVLITDEGNPNAVTDGGTGAHLTYAALQAALNNVAVNLGTIEDEAFVEETAARADEIEVAAETYLEEVEANVAAVI